jgi:starch synthase (maltosyl-transferring)
MGRPKKYRDELMQRAVRRSSGPSMTSARCARPHEHGVDVCRNFAIQCSADHRWLTEHREWFRRRADGSLKYAQDPPKRYQDISCNVNWESPAWRAPWEAWRCILLPWIDGEVKLFRVDNPHTEPFALWESVIKEVDADDRDIVFLAEAFAALP